MRWRSWFQLAFGPTESRRWNGFDARSEACGHRSDGTRTRAADPPGQLSLLHELVPNAAVIALLEDLNVPDTASRVNTVQSAAHTLGLQLVVLNVRTANDIDVAFARLGGSGPVRCRRSRCFPSRPA